MTDTTPDLTQLLNGAHRIIIFSGAGISTESGISDYRSQGGLWQRYQPVTYQEFLTSGEARRNYWQRKRELYAQMTHARPNDAHNWIARLDATGRLLGLITQNIDGLHEAAGLHRNKMIELHGSNLHTICLDCEKRTGWEESYRRLQAGEEELLCHDCQGLLKPDTISFGQSLRPSDLNLAVQWAQACDLMLVIGSSLVVEPAASLPRMAVSNGAPLVILNQSETPADDLAHLCINSPAAAFLSQLPLPPKLMQPPSMERC